MRYFLATFLCWCAAAHIAVASPPGDPLEFEGAEITAQQFGDEELTADCDGPADPRYYVQVEALALHRATLGRNANQALVVNTFTADTLISTADLANAGFQAGPRVLIGRTLCSGCAWEASYFGIDNWSARRNVTGNADLAIPGDLALASLSFFNTDSMSVSLATQLHNFELNYVRPSAHVACLAGFRYLNVTEQFQITPSDLDSRYRIAVRDNLFGAQLGARVGRQTGRLLVQATAKAGVYGNAIGQRQVVEDFGGFVLRDASSNASRTAFVGDLNLSASYAIGRRWAVRAGYNALWLTGLALATQQVDFSDTVNSGRGISSSGGLFLHGVNLGLECCW